MSNKNIYCLYLLKINKLEPDSKSWKERFSSHVQWNMLQFWIFLFYMLEFNSYSTMLCRFTKKWLNLKYKNFLRFPSIYDIVPRKKRIDVILRLKFIQFLAWLHDKKNIFQVFFLDSESSSQKFKFPIKFQTYSIHLCIGVSLNKYLL